MLPSKETAVFRLAFGDDFPDMIDIARTCPLVSKDIYIRELRWNAVNHANHLKKKNEEQFQVFQNLGFRQYERSLPNGSSNAGQSD